MSTAIFGGSFNPVHLGHVKLACAVKKAVNAERLIVVPTYISPFKQNAHNVASGQHRLEMCRLAFGDVGGAEISDYEISSGGVSYTVNTLRHFRQLMPDEKLYFIVGSDSLEGLPSWRNFPEIMSMCTVAAAARSEEDAERISVLAEKIKPYGDVVTVNIDPFEISSTEIRKKILNNEDISCYIPANVVKYIVCNKLYAADTSA